MSASLKLAALAAAGLFVYSATHGAAADHSHYAAVRYAQSKIGDPYVWGAAGPDAFDCSGLAEMAERAAGKRIARTTFVPWATLRHIPVSEVRPGDLVFFAGGDGTMSNPGHVGIVVNARRKLMIDAPMPGMDVREEGYAGASDLVGFADPGGA